MTDHPAEGKLLTCPFCGKLDAFAERFDLSSCYIQCNDCGAQGPTCCQDSDDEEMPGEDAARRAWNTRHSQGANATTNGMSFGEALDLAQEGLDRWREKEHNARWWRRIDGTPIPNDLLVNIAEVFAGRVVALSRDEKHVALSSTERPGAADALGKYGCPNCHGERLSRIVAGDSCAKSLSDVAISREQTLHFPRQAKSSTSIFARRHSGSQHDK